MNLAAVRAALAATAPIAPPPFTSIPMPPADAAPPRPAAPLSAPGGRWTRYAAKLGAALLVTTSAASIRKGGREPNDPDEQDVDRFQEALDEGLALKFGSAAAPWWLGCALAAGGVYAGMRVGAARLQDPASTPAPAIKPDHAPAKPPESPLAPSVFPPPIRV